MTGSTQTWTLDALGNWTSNSKNELTSVGSTSQGFDHDGNTLNDATTGNTYTYDAWNRLVGVKNSGGTVVAAYTYDAAGRRITKTVGGDDHDRYYSSRGQVVEGRSGSVTHAQMVWSPFYVNDMVLRDDNSTGGNLGFTGSGLGERIYVQHDTNHDVMVLVDTTGNVLERLRLRVLWYATVLTAGGTATTDAYGWLYLFQGGRIDVATGLYFFTTRDYTTTSGRWLQPDIAGYADGTCLYQMENSSPLAHVDFLGLWTINRDPNKQQATASSEKGDTMRGLAGSFVGCS